MVYMAELNLDTLPETVDFRTDLSEYAPEDSESEFAAEYQVN